MFGISFSFNSSFQIMLPGSDLLEFISIVILSRILRILFQFEQSINRHQDFCTLIEQLHHPTPSHCDPSQLGVWMRRFIVPCSHFSTFWVRNFHRWKCFANFLLGGEILIKTQRKIDKIFYNSENYTKNFLHKWKFLPRKFLTRNKKNPHSFLFFVLL